MRVALISPLFESVPPRAYGGTERVVYNLCRGLTEANHEVTVFASADSSVEGKIAPVLKEAIRLSRRKIEDPYTYNFKMLAMVAERASEFDCDSQSQRLLDVSAREDDGHSLSHDHSRQA